MINKKEEKIMKKQDKSKTNKHLKVMHVLITKLNLK